ncbi:MAG TPA: hypothetical protein DCY94_01380 [Firmicutes bacterium]|nr:hypothetical protein [Bacillota bacterium]
MAVLVNFKICDNARECGGVGVCPTGALYYDEEKKTLAIDNDKCISCGRCEKECPIGAIRVTKTDEEYEQIKKSIEEDDRKIEDLFVDRYGATPLSDFFQIDEAEIAEKVKISKCVFVELYDDDSIECLLKSIPIKNLSQAIDDEVMYYKVGASHISLEKYDISSLPALLIFKNGNFEGAVEGYYSLDEEEVLLRKIKTIYNK